MPRGLSKSKLLSHLQCRKRLWLEVHRPEFLHHSPETERGFAVGHGVTEKARELRPGGVLIGAQEDLPKALLETKRHIDAGARLLFEPAFQHDGVLVRADILSRGTRGVRINEVKASTSVKDYHYRDAAIQAWVIGRSGVKLDSISIQHVDKSFVYPGGGNYEGLFAEVPVDKEVKPLLKEVPQWIAAARSTLDGRVPKVEMGAQCGKPFSCPFQDHCSLQWPQAEYPLEILPYRSKIIEKLKAEGYRDVRDIPEGLLKNEAHIRIRCASIAGKADFDQSAAARAMKQFGHPRYFLDFETVAFAVPIWKRTRPYQKLPFQWSCHIERRPRKVEHREFLDVSGEPPMERFVASLLDAVGDKGVIFVYNASFEKERLKEMAAMFPRRRRVIEGLARRVIDMQPFVKKHYYHPAMKGSWSLKKVLPSIDPSMDYENLGKVQEGTAASAAYLEAISSDTPPERKAGLHEDLSRYCRHDTEALVRIAQFLQTGK